MPTPRLLDQVRTTLRVKHFSLSTERAYVSWIKRFILFHNKRHPNEMGELEIRQFISHLAVRTKISASTQTVALSALLFLYREVLKKQLLYIRDIERAKPAIRLTVVFTRDEVQASLRFGKFTVNQHQDRQECLSYFFLRAFPLGFDGFFLRSSFAHHYADVVSLSTVQLVRPAP